MQNLAKVRRREQVPAACARRSQAWPPHAAWKKTCLSPDDNTGQKHANQVGACIPLPDSIAHLAGVIGPAPQCSPKSRSCAAFSSESDECRGETFKFPGIEDSCGITSLSAGQADAKVLLEHDRVHWSIEQSIALSTASTHSTKATAASGPASGPRTRPRSDGLRFATVTRLAKKIKATTEMPDRTRGGGSTTFA